MNSADTAVFAQIAVVAILSIAAMSGIGMFVHAYIQRSKRASTRVASGGDDDRMRRLEQAVDSIAIEVERISEGQRFLTKLHSEKQSEHIIGR